MARSPSLASAPSAAIVPLGRVETLYGHAAVRVTIFNVRFVPNKSAPATKLWTWTYTVSIENIGRMGLTLRGRRWSIDYGEAAPLLVRGDYLDGEQPTIAPGETFTYVSGVPLPAASGIMRGHFLVETDAGDWFDATAPSFDLNLRNPLVVAGPHPATRRPKPRQDSALLNQAVASFQTACSAGTIASISTAALRTAGLSERAAWDIESFFLRHDFNEVKQDKIQIVDINHTADYLTVALSECTYDDIFLSGSPDNLHVTILNKRFTAYAQLSLRRLKLDHIDKAEATARLAHALKALEGGADLNAVLPPLPAHPQSDAAGALHLAPHQVAAVIADSTLGRLQKRYDALLKIVLPTEGLQTVEQVRAAAKLASTYDRLRQRQVDLGLDPTPKDRRVAEAERLKVAFYRQAKKTDPMRSAPPRQGRHRAAAPA